MELNKKIKNIPLKLNHIISVNQFNREFLDNFFDLVDYIKENFNNIKQEEPLKHKTMVSLFYEPSTRTRLSFELAMNHLGGKVTSTENAKLFSSAAKGESLEDTIKVINQYNTDVIVMRHYEKGASERASKVSSIPIINAGDGPGEHPTQALLDLYTIKDEFNKIDDIKIAMVGDLKNGRTVRSLSLLLKEYNNVSILYVSPKALAMKQDIKEILDKHNVSYYETEHLNEILPFVDVVYMTRIQRERFSSEEEYKKYHGYYILDNKNIGLTRGNTIIMHPLPRVNEINTSIDKSNKARYFKQAGNGLYVRMGLLSYLLK